MGSWSPDAVDFVEQHQAKLRQLPTVFFTVHLLHLDDSDESKLLRAAYTAPVRERVAPKAEMFFAGRMEYAKRSLFEKIISSVMKAPEQDLRDWNKIRAWAEQVYPQL